MENSTKSANIRVFRSTCDVWSRQDHLPPVVPTLLIINIVINSIFACMTVIGNILILISLRRTSRVHAASKALYLSLAMADLGVGIFVQPVFVIRLVAARRGLTEVCRLAGNIIDVAGVITVGVSLQTLSVISVDRVLAVHLKIRYREVATANRTRIALLICWCTSALQGVSFFINTAFYNMYQVVGISFCICVSSISYLIVFRNLRILQNQIQNWINFKFLVQYNALQEIGVHSTVGLCDSARLLCSLYTICCHSLVSWGQCDKPCDSLVYGDTFIRELGT